VQKLTGKAKLSSTFLIAKRNEKRPITLYKEHTNRLKANKTLRSMGIRYNPSRADPSVTDEILKTTNFYRN
jgi:hypothetical protein